MQLFEANEVLKSTAEQTVDLQSFQLQNEEIGASQHDFGELQNLPSSEKCINEGVGNLTPAEQD